MALMPNFSRVYCINFIIPIVIFDVIREISNKKELRDCLSSLIPSLIVYLLDIIFY